MIGVIDTGGANLTSLFAAIQRLGKQPRLVQSAAALDHASHVVLPGVGAAGDAMRRLGELRLETVIARLTQPVLGICLGMQLLFDHSEEDDTPCLGILPGRARLLQPGPALTVPHMGWSRVQWLRDCELGHAINAGEYFYFVHSYAVGGGDSALAQACHGRNFAAICQRDNFYATQFHPERSGKPGSQLLANFLNLP